MPRVFYYDVLNILACFGVICLHHNRIVHFYDVFSSTWAESLVFECEFYWAVPVFLMLSGATLMHYRDWYSTGTFFLKRVRRTVVPFVFWSLLLLGISWPILDIQSVGDVAYVLLHHRMAFADAYWFFAPLFGIYLVMPGLAWVVKEKRIRLLWYGVGALFVVCSCIPVMGKLLGVQSGVWDVLERAGYLIFPVLGYLLSETKIKRKKRRFLYIAGIGCAIFRYMMTYQLSLEAGQVDRLLFGYTQFHSVIWAAAVFVFIKSCNFQKVKGWMKDTVAKIASCSLGVFLIHMLVMGVETYAVPVSVLGYFWRFFGAFVTYGVCLLVVWEIKKIPGLRALVP